MAMTSTTFLTLEANIHDFYSKFVSGVGACFTNMSPINEITEFAAKKGYAPAFRQRSAPISFRGKSIASKLAPRTVCENHISNFLLDFDANVYNSGEVEQKIIDLMDTIKEVYFSHGFNDITYGNAQKWINMAFKYYFVIKAHFGMPGSPNKISLLLGIIKNYNFLPVDGNEREHMIYNIRRDFPRCATPSGAWSKNDNLTEFLNCWHDVSVACAGDYEKSLFYEICVW